MFPEGQGQSAGMMGVAREPTTDELLAAECNRHLRAQYTRKRTTAHVAFMIFLVGFLCAVVVWAGATKAHARTSFIGAPLPYSCEQVRWALNTFSRAHLLKLQKAMGIHLTGSQMREGQKCMGK